MASYCIVCDKMASCCPICDTCHTSILAKDTEIAALKGNARSVIRQAKIEVLEEVLANPHKCDQRHPRGHMATASCWHTEIVNKLESLEAIQ